MFKTLKSKLWLYSNKRSALKSTVIDALSYIKPLGNTDLTVFSGVT